MVFVVNSLNTKEVIATKLILEKISCAYKNLACPECSCFEICSHLRNINEKCQEVLEERLFHDNH